MTHFNWRVGYFRLGCAVLIFALIPNALIIREPVDVERAEAAGVAPDVPGLTFAEARVDWRYWVLSLAFYLAATVINGSLVHVVPMLTDRGIPIGAATAALSATGAALIVGRICSGWLIDRVFGPYVAMIVLAIPMFGIGLGGISPIVGTICLGMGIGAEIDIMPLFRATPIRHLVWRDVRDSHSRQRHWIEPARLVVPVLQFLHAGADSVFRAAGRHRLLLRRAWAVSLPCITACDRFRQVGAAIGASLTGC